MRVQFHLKGMHCEKCASTIEQSLESTAGVRDADVQFNAKTATIEFDENMVQSQTLLKKVQDLGYGASVEGSPVAAQA